MKKILFQALAFVLAVIAMQSCSCNKQHDLESKLASVISNDTRFVAVGDVHRLFDQMEITVEKGKIVLPEYLQATVNKLTRDDVGEDIEAIVDKLEGVEYDNAVLAVQMDNGNATGVLVLGVSDVSDFEKSVSEIDDDIYFYVEDNLAYLVCKGDDFAGKEETEKTVKAWRELASVDPLDGWKKDYLSRKKVCNMLLSLDWVAEAVDQSRTNPEVLKNLMDGYVGIDIDLDGPSLKLGMVKLNKEGMPVEMPNIGDFDTGLLQYATPNDFVALSFCLDHEGYVAMGQSIRNGFELIRSQPEMRDYSDVMEQYRPVVEAVSAIPAEYLSDKGVFAAFGFAEGTSLSNFDYQSPSSYHLVLAASLIPDRAKEAYNAVCGEIAAVAGARAQTVRTSAGNEETVIPVKFGREYDYLADRWSFVTVDVHIALDNDVLVISNTAVAKGEKNVFSKDVFAGSLVAGQMVVNRDTPIVSQFGLKEGLDTYGYVRKVDTGLVFTVTGVDKKFAPAVLGFITGVNG